MRSIRRTLPVILALGLGAPLAAQARRERPLTYGTSVVSYVEFPGVAFFPTTSGTDYATPVSQLSRYSVTCGGLCLATPLRLPTGAQIVYLELDYLDTDPGNDVVGSLLVCDYLGLNCTYHPAAGSGPADCLQPGIICSGTAYSLGGGDTTADLTPDAITVDNYGRSYALLGGGTSNSSSTQLSGMIVGYVLQVSPAPSTPSFNDVPTSHPFFQYIEALKASGITGGCQASPPLYCPDNPLTRGQMAVFLAKALGLQWH